MVFLLACVGLAAAFLVPAVRDRLAWRVDRLRTQLNYQINPPEEAVFVPQAGAGAQPLSVETIVAATLDAFSASLTATAASAPPATPTPAISATPLPSPTPTLVPTAIPASLQLEGVVHEYQKFNNCGPATLSMALSYWGWEGNQLDTRAFLRPLADDVDDKNVNPGEMANYINEQTDYRALVRVGGEIPLLTQLLAAGFPVIVEKGFEPPGEEWMGHYALLTGYEDERARFITQDAYIMANLPVPYAELEPRWRDFNSVYVVIYPPEQESQVMDILGEHADPQANFQAAAERARLESENLAGRDRFFALYNLGSSLVGLGDYQGAAMAYDEAFLVYSELPKEQRPWRMLWYQDGPYAAYYNVGRYQDVINLADTTLSVLAKKTLEEAFYWRGLAREGLGNRDGAVQDLQKAFQLNPYSTDAEAQLLRLGAPLP
ncbi:MAG TPA: C39 family peptidase [Anaerolineales bacterium]|nr:C39 family peptidase [Anaerolineales bacterium]